MSRMKSKETLKKALYEFLDWFETERSEHIKLFWGSVFKETIINHYPILRILRNSLMDGLSSLYKVYGHGHQGVYNYGSLCLCSLCLQSFYERVIFTVIINKLFI